MADEPELRHSLEGKLTLLVWCAALLAVIVGAGITAWLDSALLGIVIGLAISFPLTLWLLRRFMRPVNRMLQALYDGVSSLLDADFSVSIAADRGDELGRLAVAYNRIGEVLRAERHDLYQRELLLDTVIQTTPLALVLVGPNDAIIYSNGAARQLFLAGEPLEGLRFDALLGDVPAALREAVAAGRDGLFTVELEEAPETFHLSQKRFFLNARPHELYLFKHLTRELSRQEVETWKKVIRVIGHELNNSLAPVSSLAHSGKQLNANGDRDKLDVIFATIEERSRHLMGFIEGYSKFAKLPRPRIETVAWRVFVERLRSILDFQIDGELPDRPGRFDPAQIEQVLINLIKNANESGSLARDVTLAVSPDSGGFRLRVCDRGSGMSETVLKSALLPFYSTKRSGSGLGLPLCREVVESHGGRLSLANRPEGGLAVTLWLPDSPIPDEAADPGSPA